jgi:hypothetical protein
MACHRCSDIRALDNFFTRGVCHFQCAMARCICIGLPFVDFRDRHKHLKNFRYFKGNTIHFKAFGVIFLHNMFNKTYQAGHFHKKNLCRYKVLVSLL